MPAMEGSEIKRPKRGQAVWMIVNGKAALRYFVEFHLDGCRTSFTADLVSPYYNPLPLFFRSEESILLCFIGGLLSRIDSASAEIHCHRERLQELLSARKGA